MVAKLVTVTLKKVACAADFKTLAAIPDIVVVSPTFFKDHVRLAFIKVDRTSKEYAEHVSKIEGIALAFYKEKTGAFPNSNTTDETKGLDGLLPLVLPLLRLKS